MSTHQTATNHYTRRRQSSAPNIHPRVTLCNVNPLRRSLQALPVVFNVLGIGPPTDNMTGSGDLQNELLRTSHSMLKSCKWQGRDMKCERIFEPLVTSVGVCWTFFSNESLSEENMAGTVDLRVVLDLESSEYLNSTESVGAMVCLWASICDRLEIRKIQGWKPTSIVRSLHTFFTLCIFSERQRLFVYGLPFTFF